MDLVYYTHPAFFEPALSLVKALSARARVHLLMEMSPGAWQSAAFDLARRPLPPGLVPGDQVLAGAFPAGVRDYWRSAASFHLVVHPSRRSLHPSAWNLSRRVLRFAEERGADVLHVDDVDVSPRLATALATKPRMPLVIAVHDPEPHTGEWHWRKRLARRLAYPRASAFVLYNSAFREAFARRHHVPPASVRVASLGVYELFREWAPGEVADAGPTVLFFGRLSAYKGLEVFYDAVPLIAERARGCRFVVAGRPVPGYSPPPAPAVEPPARIDVMARYLSTTETARLFQQARVVVCPYTDATQSGVVLTAFAFGVPVVATDVGGLPEYVMPGRTGLLVPIRDARAVADAVSRILLDETLAMQLRNGIAAAGADDLSWAKTAGVLLELYADVAGR